MAWPSACVRASAATVGGGSLPGAELASVALVPPVRSAAAAAATLRDGQPALVGRVHTGELWIDLRTLAEVDDETLLAALRRL